MQARGIWAGPANQVLSIGAGSNLGDWHAVLIVEAQIAAMPKRLKSFQREVRRSRNLTALIFTDGATTTECHVPDVSNHGAKVVVEMPSLVPNQFELAFPYPIIEGVAGSSGDATRCWASSLPDITCAEPTRPRAGLL
jgi:hypothetical protein